MAPEAKPPPKRDGIQLDVGQSPPRHVTRKPKKKSPLVVWGSVGGAVALVVILIALGWLLTPGDPGSVTIPPIDEQVLMEGETLRLQVPVRLAGRDQGEMRYSLAKAPPDATIDPKTGEILWPTAEKYKAGAYQLVVKVSAAEPPALSHQQTFTVRLRGKPKAPPRKTTAPTVDSDLPEFPGMASFNNPMNRTNPFDSDAELIPQGKIDEFAFAKLKELEIEPAKLCSDAVFVRRAYFDVIGTLPTAEEARSFLDDMAPDKRAVLIDQLLQRPEFADYWAMKWCDLLRCKAEFPINLWPNGAQAYHRWIRTSLDENMPYDQFVWELLTACGSNFRTPQVNFFRALQSKEPESIAKAVALVFMGVRAEKWPKEQLASMAVFFSQIGHKPTREWKETVVVFDPRAAKPPKDGPPPVAAFPDGTKPTLPPGKDPREVFADWLIDGKNPWFSRHIVNRVWYWLIGRGIVHEPDDIRPDNPPQNLELLNYLAEELVKADYDLKHIYRLVLNSTTYQLSCIPKGDGSKAAENFACYPLRRLDAEVLLDALCQVTGTTESYSSMIPEPFTFIPEKQRSIKLPDGSITSSVLEMFGRPPRDTGLESERNNRYTAAQALHLLNSTHILKKIREGPKIQDLLTSTDSEQLADTLYMTILSRPPTPDEQADAGWQANSHRGAENLVWALFNSEEFLFRH